MKGIKVVSSENGAPIEQAMVDFYNLEKKKVLSLSTNDSGRVLPQIAPGEYLVKIHRPHHNSVEKIIILENNYPFGQIVIKA